MKGKLVLAYWPALNSAENQYIVSLLLFINIFLRYVLYKWHWLIYSKIEISLVEILRYLFWETNL